MSEAPKPKPRRPFPRWARLALGVVVLAIAGIAGYLAFGLRTEPPSPTLQVPVTWTTAREAPMHVLHVGQRQIACDACHGDASTVPTSDACNKCHAAETKTAHPGAAGAETTCLTCHAFGMHAAASCNGCHAKESRSAAAPPLEHHASAGLPCGSCHSVHGAKGERAVLADCTTCHAVKAAHGRFAVAPAVHDDADAAPPGLDGDAAALAYVRGLAPGTHAALPGDPHAALPGQACSTCHAPHAGTAEAQASCATCHVAGQGAITAPTIAPRGHDVAGHAACTTCHAAHDARREGVHACESCHGDHRAAADNPGHRACTGCHAPHAPTEAKTSCTGSCHAQVTVLAATRVPAHAECTSCHDPHAPKASPGEACAKCHSATKPSHPPTTGAHGAQPCTGCHAPHGKNLASAANVPAQAIAAPCTSCHTKLGNDHAAHDGKVACTQCHTPHAFRLAGQESKLCAGCHQPKVVAVSTRPGHAECTGCHGDAHAPNGKPACASCHKAEAATAPAGHAACTGCHDAHSGERGMRATCTGCHASKTNALHASATPQGCASCHRPHGPGGIASPPACTTCHARPSLGGLHAEAGHAACQSCHQAHGPPRSDRATCTTGCHADRQAHQPEAKVCKGCHLFRQ